VVQSFAAPGTTINGITWDGENLWLSENSSVLFKVTTSGGLLDSYSSPEPTPEGLTWGGSSLWLFTTNRSDIFRLSTAGDQLSKISSFKVPEGVTIGPSHDMAWDGEALWYPNKFEVYRLNTAGENLGSFTFSKEVVGLDWDGKHLWIAYKQETFANTLFSVLNTDGKVLTTINGPIFEIQSTAWGTGDHFYAVGIDQFAGAQKIYELDASETKGSIP